MSTAPLDPSDLAVKRLAYLIALAETGGYTAAAERTNVAPPTLWRQIKQLEDDLGVVLVVPAPKGSAVRLTSAGHALVSEARRVLRSSSDFLAHALAYRPSLDRTIRVGGYPAHAALFLSRLVARLEAGEMPAELVKQVGDYLRPTRNKELVDELVTLDVDLVVAPSQDEFDSELITAEPLYRWNLVAVLDNAKWSHLQGPGPIPLTELRQQPLLISPEGHDSHSLLVDEAAKKADLTLDLKIENDSVVTIISMGREGLGIPILPSDALAPDRDIVGRHGRGGAFIVRPILAVDSTEMEDTLGDLHYLYFRTADEEHPTLRSARRLARELVRATDVPYVSLV